MGKGIAQVIVGTSKHFGRMIRQLLRSGDVIKAQEILMDMTSRRATCVWPFDKEELIGEKVGKFGKGG